MGNRTLFEALTGYESPAAEEADAPQILSIGITDRDQSEPSEAEFPDIIEELDARADTDPVFAKKLADAFGVRNDREFLKQRLQEAREIVAAPRESTTLGAGVPDFSAQQDALETSDLLGVPAGFSDSYIREHVVERYWRGFPRIDLEPTLRRFEDDNALGLLGWFIFNGLDALEVPRSMQFPFAEQFGRIRGSEPFRRHGADEFRYTLDARAGGPTRVALFADFGTGLSHARFIARQIAVDGFDAAIHLGDVYYNTFAKMRELDRASVVAL